jgi:hypothetical protein
MTTVNANYESMEGSVAHPRVDRSIKSEEITVSCYENEIPAFVEHELERLYENLYSSLEKFRIYGDIDNVSTYAVHKGCELITLFLFRLEKNKVKVLNELIQISEEDVCRFENYIFSRFKSVEVILFSTIRTDIQKLPYPYQRFNCSEDIVITLPETIKEYFARLGKSTRRSSKPHHTFAQNFPSF